jgi:hypothetical protein
MYKDPERKKMPVLKKEILEFSTYFKIYTFFYSKKATSKLNSIKVA